MFNLDYLQTILWRDWKPFYYNTLARHLPSRVFDGLCFALSSRSRDIDIEKIEKSSGRFLFDDRELPEYVHILRQHYPDLIDQTISDADKILDHEFDLLGSGPLNLSKTINWHQDHKSGYIWPLDFHTRIQMVRMDDSSDIKVPWELSRFHHFNILGRAYWISGNEKYAREFVDQLLDWLAQNPPRMGANWCCPMEVAIRSANWLSAYFFFRKSDSFGPQIKRELFKSLVIHHFHVYHNLEFGFPATENGSKKHVNNNHFFTDIVGLILPAIIFPRLIFKGRLAKAQRWLDREIRSQIHSDGVHYELSIRLSPADHRDALVAKDHPEEKRFARRAVD